MHSDLHDLISTSLPGVLMVMLSLAACEIGYRTGRRAKPRTDDALRTEFFTVQSSALALLALLLSFSFSIGAASFSSRKQVIVNEATVISDLHLHSRLLPEPTGSEVRALLLQYLDTRLDLYHAGLDIETVRRKLLDSRRLQNEIWARVVAVAKQDPHSIPTGQVIQSLSGMTQLNARRVAALTPSMPTEMLVGLALATAVAMSMVGWGIGLGSRRTLTLPLILSILFGFIVAVIVDLDQPRSGIVRVGQRALTDLQETMQQAP